MSEPFVLARTAAGGDVVFRPALANRHGLIAGATGTGKTVTATTTVSLSKPSYIKVVELGGQWAGPGQDKVVALAKG